MTSITERAPAKINLTLGILGRRADGYHEIESLVAFADIGDVVTLDTANPIDVRTSGPFAGSIEGANLIETALRALRDAEPRLGLGSVTLDKHLPVAAGLGGGSADAAATLRAVRQANPGLSGSVDWETIAVGLGADVPVCLRGRAAFMRGIGERVSPVDPMPGLEAVLINPGLPLSTARVFAALDAKSDQSTRSAHGPPDGFASVGEVFNYVCAGTNDLESAASRLMPQIETVKAALRSAPQCVIARMSGSGPTCFGLFETREAAEEAARTIGSAQPGWWVVAIVLN